MTLEAIVGALVLLSVAMLLGLADVLVRSPRRQK